MNKLSKIIIFSFLGLFLAVGYAAAIPYGFDNVTTNDVADVAIGEAQLSVNVTDYGANKVLFTFTNTGPLASSITDIYFDDDIPVLTGASASFIYDQVGGVSYTTGAAPPDLPGGANAPFYFQADYGFDSGSPTQPNGVNPGESLGILFDLVNNIGFNDVIAGMNSGDLRVGIHVQGFASGGSESFINTRPGGGPVVPEPGTVFLLGFGLVGLLAFGRRKNS